MKLICCQEASEKTQEFFDHFSINCLITLINNWTQYHVIKIAALAISLLADLSCPLIYGVWSPMERLWEASHNRSYEKYIVMDSLLAVKDATHYFTWYFFNISCCWKNIIMLSHLNLKSTIPVQTTCLCKKTSSE